MNIKVLAVAPYQGLADLLKNSIKGEKRIELDVEIADLEEALPLTRRAEQQGYDVIVSRGGTASLLRNHTSLPVVEIPVSGYDILRVLTLIKDSNSKVAIIGFPNVCEGAATILNLLNFDIPLYPVESANEVPGVVQKAFRNGASIVLGDVVTVRTAKDLGYHGILITSGKESVEEALQHVERVADIYQSGRAQADFYKNMTELAPYGILVLDKHGKIVYANKSAADLTGREIQRLQGRNLRAISQNLALYIEHAATNLHRSTDQIIVIDGKPIKVRVTGDEGLAYFILYLYGMGDAEQERVHIDKTIVKPASFNQIIGSSVMIKQTIKKAMRFANSERNVLICGEPGTEKEQFAQAIHSESRHKRGFFYRFSCNSDVQSLDRELFGNGDGLLRTGIEGTVYLENIDRLSPLLQAKLLGELRSSISYRLISSTPLTMSQLVDGNILDPELIALLGQLYLPIPALRERPEDIDDVARVLIAAHNSQHGKHIVGLRESVMEKLQNHTWQGNLEELQNVLEEMLMLTNGHFVEEDHADPVWQRLGQAAGRQSAAVSIDGTWEEIQKRIWLQVLKEEGMNQSKAAKRLGINRSTLWRKLHDVLQNETNGRL